MGTSPSRNSVWQGVFNPGCVRGLPIRPSSSQSQSVSFSYECHTFNEVAFHCAQEELL